MTWNCLDCGHDNVPGTIRCEACRQCSCPKCDRAGRNTHRLPVLFGLIAIPLVIAIAVAVLSGCKDLAGSTAAKSVAVQQSAHAEIRQVEDLNALAREHLNTGLAGLLSLRNDLPAVITTEQLAAFDAATQHVKEANATLAKVPEHTKAAAAHTDAAAALNVKATGEAEKFKKDLEEERSHFFSHRQRVLLWKILAGFIVLGLGAVALFVWGGPIGATIGTLLVHNLPAMSPFSFLQDRLAAWRAKRQKPTTPTTPAAPETK